MGDKIEEIKSMSGRSPMGDGSFLGESFMPNTENIRQLYGDMCLMHFAREAAGSLNTSEENQSSKENLSDASQASIGMDDAHQLISQMRGHPMAKECDMKPRKSASKPMKSCAKPMKSCAKPMKSCAKPKKSCAKPRRKSACGKPKRKPACAKPKKMACAKPMKSACARPKKSEEDECEQPKCSKPGPVTNNGYLNFLRSFRKKNCGLKPQEIFKAAAKAWCAMSEEKKDRYRRMACKVTQSDRHKRRRICQGT
ncbi:protamine-like protein 99C [Drosophila ficusphila]|uniref:protamine-like protein 99C n=1 Tax=Drosophila ficusphila TaxID=30025 RepID=UPI0007E7E4E6|nr:protamine-like protein 99C [Drosophila ficusphila]